MMRVLLVLLFGGLFVAAPMHADEQSVCAQLIELLDGLLDSSEGIGMSEEVEQHLRDHHDQAQQHLEAGDETQCVESIEQALAIREFDQ